uniref:Uncharacterized protein n=1 Tax=Strongyloides stercoralis TaxID=6248 RepID=A0A0K0EL56_STRER
MINNLKISFEKFILLVEALKEIELKIEKNDTYEIGSKIGLKYFSIFHNNKLESLLPSKMKDYIKLELENYILMNDSLKLLFLSLIKDVSSFEEYLLQLIKYAEILGLQSISVITTFIVNTSDYLTEEEMILSDGELNLDLHRKKITSFSVVFFL